MSQKLLTFTILFCAVWALEKVEDEGKIISGLHERISIIESKLAAKEAKIAGLEYLLSTKMSELQVGLQALQTELAEKTQSLQESLSHLVAADLQLEDKLEKVGNPPFAFICGYQDRWGSDNSVISYDKLLYNNSGGYNASSNGDLDLESGLFRSGYRGTWLVTWSTQTSHWGGANSNTLHLYKNGEKIEETEQHTGDKNAGSDGNDVEMVGGRSLYLALEDGDTLHLQTEDVNYLNHITVCYSLEQFA